MSYLSQFSNCSEGSTDLVKINLVFSLTGAVCCFISTLIVVLILCCKAYRTVLQRLFLYLMVAITLRELFIAAAIEHHWKYPLQDKVCMSIGFLWNWTGVLVFVFTVGIKIYLFFFVRHIARGSMLPRFLYTKHRRVIMESLYVCLLTAATLGYAAIPFITNNYGIAGGWCWIRALDENCKLSRAGLLNQLFNGYIFYVSGSVIGLVLLIAVSIMYCRLPITNNESRLLLRKTFSVIITFLVNLVIMGFALAARVTAAKEKEYEYPAIWISFGITFPISLLLFPMAYFFFFSFGNKARELLSFVCICFRRREHRRHRGRARIEHSMRFATNQESTHTSANSTTASLEVPYTDAFTHISESEIIPVLHTDAARGYGTING